MGGHPVLGVTPLVYMFNFSHVGRGHKKAEPFKLYL